MSNIVLSEMPFVLEGDITDSLTQSPLYLIQNGDELTGLSSASDSETDSGSLNLTSIQLYKDIIELQKNQNTLLNTISQNNGADGISSNNNNKYTSANLPEYITGNWNFTGNSTFSTITIKNKLQFKNDYNIERTLNLDNNIDGRFNIDAPLVIDNLAIKVGNVPKTSNDHGVLFLDSTKTLKILYDNGAVFTLFSIDGNNGNGSGNGGNGSGNGSAFLNITIYIETYTQKTNSTYNFNYFEFDVFHGLERNVITPTFIDSNGCYIDAEYETIDQNTIKVIVGEPIQGTLLIT
jgi:hypothetical protein